MSCSKPYRVGQWLPSDKKVLDKWLANLIKDVEVKSKDKLELLMSGHPPAEDEAKAMGELRSTATLSVTNLHLHKPVEDLMNAILTDPEINMFFHQMFWQQYSLPNTSGVKIPSWQLMIVIIDHIMTTAPEYNKTGLVGFPINVILNWPMATTAGFAAFLNDKVNRLFKNILNYWGIFLSSPDSCYVLSKDPRNGWFGEDAMLAMPNFEKEFKCNPKAEHYGFKSWDDFFTREYRPRIRLVESPDDDYIVANACESAPFKIATGVKQRDFFWIKKQRYSLDFMLNMDGLAKQFYGGTVYQAFLSATSYHRWHSPVSGTIYKTELVDGSYYSQTHNIQDDPAAPNESQGYLAQVAARGIIYIQADNPDIGMMCFVSIGMSEVSSNEITVRENDKVKKGDQLGMFHFGGSTHCLIFRPEVKIEFDTRGQTPGLHDLHNIPVKAKIATVFPARK
ncbi:L-tryptophan decarboxylase-like [Anneissia japonica]|uniref:L-tryptophan decarboxylase-like n=1 Tax=Anneissia japonica TaxID=1529436 RepID=UPI0014256B3F|nr:L-tryptophan decarboxylase-like [Anneissia japonica]